MNSKVGPAVPLVVSNLNERKRLRVKNLENFSSYHYHVTFRNLIIEVHISLGLFLAMFMFFLRWIGNGGE